MIFLQSRILKEPHVIRTCHCCCFSRRSKLYSFWKSRLTHEIWAPGKGYAWYKSLLSPQPRFSHQRKSDKIPWLNTGLLHCKIHHCPGHRWRTQDELLHSLSPPPFQHFLGFPSFLPFSEPKISYFSLASLLFTRMWISVDGRKGRQGKNHYTL